MTEPNQRRDELAARYIELRFFNDEYRSLIMVCVEVRKREMH